MIEIGPNLSELLQNILLMGMFVGGVAFMVWVIARYSE